MKLISGSRKRAAEAFQDVPDGEVHQMVELNARKFYNLTETPVGAPPAETPAQSPAPAHQG
jgi:hypothetical protein